MLRSSFSSAARAVLAACIVCATAQAGNVWDGGGGNNNWTTGSNWNSDNLPPANNGLIDVVMGGTTRLTPNVNAAYDIRGLIFNFDAGAFVLGGQTLTIRAGGILQGDTGNQRINNAIVIGASQTWDAFSGPLRIGDDSFGGGTVNLGGITPHTLNFSGAFDTTIHGGIEGFGTLVKFGAGTLTLSGTTSNTYVGATIVNSGTLILNKFDFRTAIPTNLIIGDGVGNDDVVLNASEQIADTSLVTINSSGALALHSGLETIGGLTMTGSGVGLAAGSELRVAGDLTFNAAATTTNIYGSGTFNLGGVARTFDIPDGTPSVDLHVSSSLMSGGLTKSGLGTMRLTAENTLFVPNVVNGGELQLGCIGRPAIQGATSGSGVVSLRIGDDIGGPGADRVVFIAHQQVGTLAGPDNTPLGSITVRNSGLLDINGFTQDTFELTLTGGQVSTGAGWIGFHYLLNVGASSLSSSISGHLRLNGIPTDSAPRNIIIVADGVAADDLDLSAAITDSPTNSSFSKAGPGTMRLSGSAVNSHTVPLSISNGTVVLAKTVPDAALSSVIVGSGGSVPVPGPSTLVLAASEQIAGSVTVSSQGTFDMNGFSETLTSLTLVQNAGAGRLVTGGGVLTVGTLFTNSNTEVDSGAGTIVVTGGITHSTVPEDNVIAVVVGAIDLGGGVRTISVADAADLDTELRLTAGLHNGGWTKIGAGKVELTGAAMSNTGNVTVAEGGVLLNKSGPGGSRVLVTTALTIDTTDALLDVWEHAVIVDYTSSSPLSSVRFAITAAYADGAWTGFGLTSSLADATHGVGYAESGALGISLFESEPVDSTSVLIKFTHSGDANLDGQVDITDLAALATNWQTAKDWSGGDFDYDGFVDITDLARLATNWQAGVGNPLAPSLAEALAALGLPVAVVPEPLSVTILGIGGFFLHNRRRRMLA